MVIFHSYVSLPEGILPGAFLSRSPILSVAPWHGPWVMLLAPWSLGQFCCLQSQWGFHEISMALSTPCQTSPVAFWWFLHVSAPSQATPRVFVSNIPHSTCMLQNEHCFVYTSEVEPSQRVIRIRAWITCDWWPGLRRTFSFVQGDTRHHWRMEPFQWLRWHFELVVIGFYGCWFTIMVGTRCLVEIWGNWGGWHLNGYSRNQHPGATNKNRRCRTNTRMFMEAI